MKYTPANKFIYDEETRLHTLGGKRIPSVSEVIAPLYNYSHIPLQTLNHKRDLGIAFHSAIALYLKDDLDFESLDPQLIKPMEAFLRFWTAEVLNIREMIVEEPVYHEKLKYCGKPDLVTETKIYDWKLRPYNAIADILQMSAYSNLYGMSSSHLIVVCFELDGSYKVHNICNSQAWPIFRKMLDRWKSEQKFNLLLNQWKESVK